MKALPVFLLAVVTAFRLWLAAVLAVTPLEAYYWMCAQRPDLAFFDGPAGTAWLVHLGGIGGDPLALRWTFPVFAAIASIAAFLVGRQVFGPAAGLWSAAILNALPFFNIAAVHAGPGIPALAFALLATWALLRAMHYGLPWWALSGLLLAAAEQFHYAAIFLLFGAAAICLFSARHRSEWRAPGIYLMAAAAFAGLVPGIVWNQAHDWPILALGTLRTALTPRWGEIGPALVSTVLLFSLVALAVFAFSAWALSREVRVHNRPRLLFGLAAPFFLLWLCGVLHGNPSSVALLFACALFSSGAAHIFLETSLLRRIGAFALLLTAALSAMPSSSDPWTLSRHGISWREVAESLETLLENAQDPKAPPLLLIAQDPDATAALKYHLSRTAHPEVFLRESQDVSNQFALWPRYDDFVETAKPVDDFFKMEGSTTNPYLGRNALYLTDEEPADLPQTIASAFARTSPFAALDLGNGRKLRVYLCEDYQTMPL